MEREFTLLGAAEKVRQGEMTPRQLVERCLQRIDRFEGQTRAWVSIDAEGARREADRLGAELAAGNLRGPLHGIPLGIKDIVDVAGAPTRAGSTLTPTDAAARDATVVARLRAAGAIVLGKTVTTEFACFDPPPTRNPWNPAHTPGGSSSGSAAAVALGMCVGALGSQTGGSITRPASFCGVAGVKPTLGRVSRAGVVPVSYHLDHVGPISRTIEDCAAMLAAISGTDVHDGACAVRPPLELSAEAFRPGGLARGIERPRLGVLREFFFTGAEPETAALCEAALSQLEAAGAELVEVTLPAGFDRVHAMHRRIMACEAAEFHRRAFGAPRAGYGPNMAALLEEGLAVSMAEYQEALQHQVAFRHAVQRTIGTLAALVTPSTPGAAPASLATTGDARFNSPWSHAGVPTVSFPVALTEGGMPVSLQLVGQPWSEAQLLAVGAWCEEQIGFDLAPAHAD
jgi:aspartyl-tRNA(Asn)/glutamyl-tRNA(Gln) amidotransferase subunit A